MNSLKKLLQSSKFLVVTLVFSLFLFSQSAIAATKVSAADKMFSISIIEGKFDFDVHNIDVEDNFRVGSAIISLPEGETGMIEEIVIIGPDGQREYGCVNIQVQNGTDLIESCGGPAYLKKGNTEYQAKGSKFNPNLDVKLGVNLSISESEAI